MGDDGVKSAWQCVVERSWVIGHRDDEAFRLGAIEEREKHVENAARVHDVRPLILGEPFPVSRPDDASYRQSPYQEPVTGLDAIRRMWDDERDGPDEVFTIATDILAVDGPTAVVRAEVRYGEPLRQEYRDLWILQLNGGGRCTRFEEWPYWPGQDRAATG